VYNLGVVRVVLLCLLVRLVLRSCLVYMARDERVVCLSATSVFLDLALLVLNVSVCAGLFGFVIQLWGCGVDLACGGVVAGFMVVALNCWCGVVCCSVFCVI